MEIEGDYQRDGYALVRAMVPRGVARALMAQLKADLPPGPLPRQDQDLTARASPRPVNFTFAEGLVAQ